MLYNLLSWVYKRPGRRVKAGQLHEAGCICLLLREKMRLLLVWSSGLTWATLSGLQRAGQDGEMGFDSAEGSEQGQDSPQTCPVKLLPVDHFPSSVWAPSCSQKCTWVAFCPFFSPSINIANAPVINTTERDSLEDVNIHQSFMICIWIQKIGLWLLTALLSLWFPHALNAGGLNTWGSLWS